MFRLPVGTVRARGPVQASRLGGVRRCSIRRPSRAGPSWRSALVTASQMVKIGQVVGAAGEAALRPYTAGAIHPRCAEHLPRFGAIAPVSSGPDPPARQGRELSGRATMTVARGWSMPLRRLREMGCARARWVRRCLAPTGVPHHVPGPEPCSTTMHTDAAALIGHPTPTVVEGSGGV